MRISDWSSDVCSSDLLVERIDAHRRPSTIADATGDGYFRTSETCDLDASDPFVAGIDAKLAAFVGIDPAHGEPIQGQRYALGQEFKEIGGASCGGGGCQYGVNLEVAVFLKKKQE